MLLRFFWRPAISAGVAHNDVKAGNIALSSDCAVKLIDFGVSAPIKQPLIRVNGTDGSLTRYVVRALPPLPILQIFDQKYIYIYM
jgi:serine/threonine protein kinase